MRAPRYQFPNEVRETTRLIASRMTSQGAVAGTPEELEAWIAAAPDLEPSLTRGGYGTRFTAHDLLPLLQVFAGTTPAPVEPVRPAGADNLRWVLASVAVAAILIAVAFISGAIPRAKARWSDRWRRPGGHGRSSPPSRRGG